MSNLVNVDIENFGVSIEKMVAYLEKFGDKYIKEVGFNETKITTSGLVFKSHNGYSVYNEDEVFEAIAPFINEGATLTYHDKEEGIEPPYRYVFTGGKVLLQKSKIVWE